MKPAKIILHCSATPNGRPLSIEEVRVWHTARGFVGPDGISGTEDDAGYHLLIDVDGRVDNGRGLNQVGAHCEGENHDSIGICLVGTDRFTRAQFNALRYKLDSIFLTYDIKKWALRCHNEFESARKQGKSCPGMDVGRLLVWYLLQDDAAIQPYLHNVA